MRLEQSSGWLAPGERGLVWLGQAGFWIDTGSVKLLIDPYLSDSLARKYAGKKHDHKRMMPPPVAPADVPRPDIVLVTHGHTDHMDPDTLAPLAERFPGLPFVVPAARLELARARIGADARLIGVDAGSTLSPLPGLRLTVFPAAHETLERDALGHHLFLGYGIAADGLRFYHSGDCVPFAGLDGFLRRFAPDIALLPVNGRDAQRRADGIPGNFTLAEAVDLASETPYLIPHHFGMFAFNTLDPAEIEVAARERPRPRIVRPRAGEAIRVT